MSINKYFNGQRNNYAAMFISYSIPVTRKGGKSTAYNQYFEEIKITLFLIYEGLLNVTCRI